MGGRHPGTLPTPRPRPNSVLSLLQHAAWGICNGGVTIVQGSICPERGDLGGRKLFLSLDLQFSGDLISALFSLHEQSPLPSR